MSRHPRVFFAMALLSTSLFAGQAFADRTLTDEEVGGAMNKILKALEELGAQIRS